MTVEELEDNFEKAGNAQKYLNDLLEEAKEKLEAKKRVAEGLKGAFEGIASKMGITNNSYSKVLKNTGQMLTDLQKIGKGDFMKKAVGAAADVFSVSISWKCY